MKIATNTSDIPTQFLRTVFTGVHNHLKKTEGACRAWRYLEVTVRQSQTKRNNSGRAWLRTGPMILTFSRREIVFDEKVYPILTTRGIAWIFYHELMHVYGYGHKQYNDIPKGELDALIVDWPKYPPKIEVKEKSKVDHVAKRAASVDTRIKSWESKLKRATTALKKLKAQRKYYAKKLSEPRPEPKPRKPRKRRGTIWEVAAQHGCTVEKGLWDEGYEVWPPKGLFDNAEDDPYEGGGHACDDAKEARRRVMVYANLASPSTPEGISA